MVVNMTSGVFEGILDCLFCLFINDTDKFMVSNFLLLANDVKIFRMIASSHQQ